VVTWAGVGALLEQAPRRIIASGEVGVCAAGVGVVAEGSDRAADAHQQGGRRLGAGAPAGGNVSRADQDRLAEDRLADLLPHGQAARPKGGYHHRNQRQRCC